MTAGEVLDQCRANLARYKIPKQVRIVSELRISPQGKVLKTELRRRYAEPLGTRASSPRRGQDALAPSVESGDALAPGDEGGDALVPRGADNE